MWWEIIPSFAIITTVMAVPVLATRAINRLAHDGNPYKRCYTSQDPYAVFQHKRDMGGEKGRPSFWQAYVKADKQGNATPYKTNTLADM